MSFHTILPEVHELMPPMVALRQHLHAHPELSEEEFDTSRLVADKLRDWGYDVHHGLAGTGVVASLRKGQSQRIVGLRADMDALPIVETSGLPYASRHSGKMHACATTAIPLCSGRRPMSGSKYRFRRHRASYLSTRRGGIPGAKRMVEDGLFQRFPAMRYSPCTIGRLPVGCFGFLPSLHGLGRYGNDPHQRPGATVPCPTKRPIRSSPRSLVMALQTVVARNLPPLDTGVVGIDQFMAAAVLQWCQPA